MKLSSAVLGALLTALSVRAAISKAELRGNTAKGLRLISLEDGIDPVWKTEDEKLELMRAFVKFVSFSWILEERLGYAESQCYLVRCYRGIRSKHSDKPTCSQLQACTCCYM